MQDFELKLNFLKWVFTDVCGGASFALMWPGLCLNRFVIRVWVDSVTLTRKAMQCVAFSRVLAQSKMVKEEKSIV